MKMRKILVTMLIACACLTACGKEDATPEINMNVPLTEELEQAIIEAPVASSEPSVPVIEEDTTPSIDASTVETEETEPLYVLDIDISKEKEPEVVPVLEGLKYYVDQADRTSTQVNKPEIGEDYTIIAAAVYKNFDVDNATVHDFSNNVNTAFLQTTDGTLCEINSNGIFNLGNGYYKDLVTVEDILEAVDYNNESSEYETWLSFVEEE